MKRTAARELAIQLGFAAVAAEQDPAETLETFFEPEHYASMAGEGELYAEKPSKWDRAFIAESVTGVADHRVELNAYIGKYARGWRPERISRSAAAVLRQAMYEMLYMPDIPPGASIDEAVELAKGYEDPEVVAFINGVLGGFYRGELAQGEALPSEPAMPEADGDA